VVKGLTWQSNGKCLLTVGDDSVVREVDATTGELVRPAGPTLAGRFVQFTATGYVILGQPGIMNPWQILDPRNDTVLFEREAVNMVISPDSAKVACIGRNSNNGRFELVDTKTLDEQVARLELGLKQKMKAEFPELVLLGFTADSRAVVLTDSSYLYHWDTKTGKQTSVWSLTDDKIWDMQFGKRSFAVLSPDGSHVAFAWTINDKAGRAAAKIVPGRLMVVEAATGKVEFQGDMEVGTEEFQAVAFSPDSKLLAAAWQRQIGVWEIGNPKTPRQFEGHRGPVTSLAFSAGDSRLASASADGTVLVWDVSKR
jgi:WD40 repeat protein